MTENKNYETSSEKPPWKSKKFWSLIVGIVALFAAFYVHVPEEMIITIGGMISAYIFGQAAVDWHEEKSPDVYISEIERDSEEEG